MPKNLHKVQKQVAKKRGGKPNALHENSRDVKRLQRASQREEKLARQIAVREKGKEGYCEFYFM
jgi:translation machinery-associated protein 16